MRTCSRTPRANPVILSCVWRALAPNAAEGSRCSPLRYNRSNLFAAAFVLIFSFTFPGADAQTTSLDALLTQANDALQKHDYSTAEKLLTTLTQASPNDTHLLFNLGLTADHLDHATEAETAYRAASAADPKFAAPHLALGLLLARSNKNAEARTELLAAANLPPDPEDPAPTARALRALAQLDLSSNAADARDELLAALKLSPETPEDILLSARIAESLNDLALAETAYTRYLAVTPADAESMATLAHILLRENKPAAAESLLTTALAAHPGDTALTAQLASAYLAESDTDPAKSALAVPLVEALHQQHPAETSVTRLLAGLYARTKQPEKAGPFYAALLQQTPNDPTLLADDGSNLLHLRRYPEAEAILKRSVADPAAFPSPDDLAAAYSDLAFSASENNDPTMTLQALDLRAKVASNTAGSIFLAATAQDKLHQYKQAAELYKQFLDIIKVVANGKFADQEWEARHRLIALEHRK